VNVATGRFIAQGKVRRGNYHRPLIPAQTVRQGQGGKPHTMKTKIILLGVLVVYSIHAQTNQPSEIHRIEFGKTENINCEIVRVYPKYIAVMVNDPNYHLNFTPSGPISEDGKILIIENYGNMDQAAQGQVIHLHIKQIGTIKSTSGDAKVFELWHCITWQDEQEEEKDAAKRMADNQAMIDKQKENQTKAEQAKIYALQAKAINWLKPQATNGSASAQCSLGLHYLNGQGCETNREQAIYWLTQAANQGDQEASNKLASLQK
jgi:hypothetical protein